MAAKAPGMTIISVGSKAHGQPHKKSLEFYEKGSKGSRKGRGVNRHWQNQAYQALFPLMAKA